MTEAGQHAHHPDDDAPAVDAAQLAADALRLIGTAQEWARRTFADPPFDAGHTGPECQWCPLCQFVSVVRGERPEITQRVAEAGAALTTMLRSLLDQPAEAGEPTAHAPRVQRIDLGANRPRSDETAEDGPQPSPEPPHRTGRPDQADRL